LESNQYDQNPASTNRIPAVFYGFQNWQNPAALVRFQLVWLESSNDGQTSPDFNDGCRIPFYAVGDFFVLAESRKKLFSSKIFYDGKHFTSKQT
jgi:hypothetical protein